MLFFVILAALCLAAPLECRVVKRQTLPCPQDCEQTPLDIAFVVDGSASIWPDNFTIGLWFMQNFVDKFNIGPDQVRVSVVTYGDRVYEEDAFDFNSHTDKDSLNVAIDSIPYRSGTATKTGPGIRYMLDNQLPLARDGVRRVIIVMTDGQSQEPDVTKAEAERAHAAGLEVFAIGIGGAVDMRELHNIASDGKHVFIVGSYQMLDDILDRLAFETCGVTPHPPCQYDPVDIAFVIDSSQSIKQDNFTIGLEFIKEFIEVFEINPTAVRVATIMFGERVYDEYAMPFDAYSNKKDTIDAILALPWMHGTKTETGPGIDYMVDHFLPNTRPHAAHIGIVITDGKSQRWKATKLAASEARNHGITMFAVGVGELGKTIDQTELENIAGDPSRVLTAVDYARLNTIREELTHITCTGITDNLRAKAPQ